MLPRMSMVLPRPGPLPPMVSLTYPSPMEIAYLAPVGDGSGESMSSV